MSQSRSFPNLPFIEAFERDLDLQRYNQNSLAMFVMNMYLGIDDLNSFAADTIVDGGNDKKIDLCHIDFAERRAIIGQCYLSEKWGKESANANKASYINTGLAWLLSMPLIEIPLRLRSKAQELRTGIAEGSIERIELLFIHNAYSSKNVENELLAAKSAAFDLANKLSGDHDVDVPIISAKEFGLIEIQELFQSIDTDIVVNEWLNVPVERWIPESSQAWNSIVASVPAKWLQDLRINYGDKLVSANFRNYLGTRSTKTNINHQIKTTLVEEPENFWVYNNGITALTHQISESNGKLRIRGISIINGAQTSGALGEANPEKAEEAKVLCRIVSSKYPALVNKIIRYNNTQNKIVAADKRSNEAVFKRLENDFNNEGMTFVIRRSHGRNPSDAIVASDIGRVLAAFHGDPQLGYRNPSTIFDDDKVFRKVFPTEATAEHVFLVSALAKAYDKMKFDLKNKVSAEAATDAEVKTFNVLQFTSSRYFIIFVTGYISEQLIGQKIVNLYDWKSTSISSSKLSKLENAWHDVLNTVLPFINNSVTKIGDNSSLENASFEVPRNAKLSSEVAREIQAIIRALDTSLNSNYKALRDLTKS